MSGNATTVHGSVALADDADVDVDADTDCPSSESTAPEPTPFNTDRRPNRPRSLTASLPRLLVAVATHALDHGECPGMTIVDVAYTEKYYSSFNKLFQLRGRV